MTGTRLLSRTETAKAQVRFGLLLILAGKVGDRLREVAAKHLVNHQSSRARG